MIDASAFRSALCDWMDGSMHRSMHGLMLYARTNGLSMAQFGVLLHASRGISGVCEVGDDMGISSAAASQMLERMVQQGLVSRRQDPHDRRVKQVVLTEKGQAFLQDGLRASRVWMDDLAASLSPSEADQVAAVLALLSEKAQQIAQSPDP